MFRGAFCCCCSDSPLVNSRSYSTSITPEVAQVKKKKCSSQITISEPVLVSPLQNVSFLSRLRSRLRSSLCNFPFFYFRVATAPVALTAALGPPATSFCLARTLHLQLNCSKVLSPGQAGAAPPTSDSPRWLLCAEDWLLPDADGTCVAYSFRCASPSLILCACVVRASCGAHTHTRAPIGPADAG